ncbi:hypothetical protein ABAC460_19240 [Asticcacaulis sp. AC460]|nr:hypothetical protein ABAC460_19240 [Asticcacaulis sp. AC460]
MSDPFYEWREAYAGLIGCELRVVAWMPITADTPDVVTNLGAAAFVFSGAVMIAPAEGSDVFLTWAWKPRVYGYHLAVSQQVDWQAGCLDRIRCRFDGPWEGVQGARLIDVRLFQAPSMEGGLKTAAIRHTVAGENGDVFFWIGCGDAGGVGDHDDLWVGVNVEPANLADLVEVLVLTDQAKT